MKILTTLNTVNFLLIISELTEAEESRNFEEMKRLFSPIWNDFDEDPHFDEIKAEYCAELIRLAGVFLILYGKANNLTNYQLRGKDLLTKAKDRFFELDNLDKAIKCQIVMATAYYQEGGIEEKKILLEDALSFFENQPEHPLALLIHVNLLIVEIAKNELEEAYERVEKILVPITQLQDNKLKAQFYAQRAIILRKKNDLTESIASSTLAIEYAKKIPNIQFEALIKNSLAVTYLSDGKLDLALRYVDQAINLINEIGWNANFYDTKANIYYKMGEYNKALEFAEMAVSILKSGEDYGSYVEALWTQILAMIRLNFQNEAIELFLELQNVASFRIGEKTANWYLKKFLNRFFIIPDGNYFDKVATFKKHLVIEALSQTTVKTQAAEILGVKRQALDDILTNQFPELSEDFGISKKPRCKRK